MRQSVIAVFAMALVLAVAGYEDLNRKETEPKLRISGKVTQWSTLGSSAREASVSFRLGAFPYELGIDAGSLELLAKQGVREPVGVGSRVAVIVARSEVAAREAAPESNSARPSGPIQVLGLIVDGQPILGAPEVFRVAPSMRTWPYLLLASMFGAALVFGYKRSTRRRRRRVDYDGGDSSSG